MIIALNFFLSDYLLKLHASVVCVKLCINIVVIVYRSGMLKRILKYQCMRMLKENWQVYCSLRSCAAVHVHILYTSLYGL